MDQEKFFQMQMQMKRNNEDYHDFVQGLDSWSEELKGRKSVPETKISTQPVRNAPIKVKKSKKKIPAYDYAAWEKFDVEDALKSADETEDIKPCKIKSILKDDHNISESGQKILDKNESKTSKYNSSEISNIKSDDQSESSIQRSISNIGESNKNEESRVTLARKHREIGNTKFKEGDFVEATAEYSKAILYHSTDSVLYTNRAMSLMKMGSFDAAEIDCCKAIELERASVKAFYRRAKCRIELGRKEEALEDLRTVLQIDPENKVASKDLRELEKELNIRGVVEPIYGQPRKDRESSKPLRRVNIVDVDPHRAIVEHVTSAANSSVGVQHIPSKDGDVVIESGMRSAIVETVGPISFAEPTTAVQLTKDLNKYRKDPLVRARYISNIAPGNYRRLVGHSMDCKLLQDFTSGLASALGQGIISQDTFVENMNALSEVARFPSLWLMMSEEEKRDFLEASDSLNDEVRSLLRVSR